MNILLLSHPHFKDAFERLGHTVTFYRGDEAEALDVSERKADLIILHESLGMRHIPHGLDRARVPTVFYSVDVHLNLYWHKEFACLFDYVFVSQKDYVDGFKHENAFWLPWSINPELFKDHNLERTYDIVFIGTMDEQRVKRRNIINELSKRFNVTIFGTDPGKRLTHQECSRIYSQAKIILNESICGEITFRTFEAMACGGMLLTETIENGLSDLFTDRNHLITYDRHDFIEKAAYYLENGDERLNIAGQGRDEVIKNHTVDKRAAAMLEVLENNKFRKRNNVYEKHYLHYGKTLYFTGMRFPRYKKRRLQRARMLLKKAREAQPDAVEPVLYSALLHGAQDELQTATEIIYKYAEKHELSFHLLVTLGILELKTGNQEKALRCFHMISPELLYDEKEFYPRLGREFEKRHMLYDSGYINSSCVPMNAVDCYTFAQSSDGIYNAGILLYNLGLYDGASNCFTSLKSKGYPGDGYCKYAGLTYSYAYNLPVALDALADVFSINDIDQSTEFTQDEKHLMKGLVYLKEEKFDYAIKELEQSTHDDALLLLGKAYTAINRFSEALSFFEKAVEKRRYDPETYELVGTALTALGDQTGAQKAFKKSHALKNYHWIQECICMRRDKEPA